MVARLGMALQEMRHSLNSQDPGSTQAGTYLKHWHLMFGLSDETNKLLMRLGEAPIGMVVWGCASKSYSRS